MFLENLADLLADPAKSADDVMIPQPADLFVHFPPFEQPSQLALDHRLGDFAEGVHNKADAADHQKHGEHPASGMNRHDVAVPHREHGNNGQVHAHPEPGVLKDHVPKSANEEQRQKYNSNDDDFPHGILSES